MGALGLGDDRPQRALGLGVVGQTMDEELCAADDDGERIVQLVAGAGGELGQRVEQFLAFAAFVLRAAGPGSPDGVAEGRGEALILGQQFANGGQGGVCWIGAGKGGVGHGPVGGWVTGPEFGQTSDQVVEGLLEMVATVDCGQVTGQRLADPLLGSGGLGVEEARGQPGLEAGHPLAHFDRGRDRGGLVRVGVKPKWCAFDPGPGVAEQVEGFGIGGFEVDREVVRLVEQPSGFDEQSRELPAESGGPTDPAQFFAELVAFPAVARDGVVEIQPLGEALGGSGGQHPGTERGKQPEPGDPPGVAGAAVKGEIASCPGDRRGVTPEAFDRLALLGMGVMPPGRSGDAIEFGVGGTQEPGDPAGVGIQAFRTGGRFEL